MKTILGLVIPVEHYPRIFNRNKSELHYVDFNIDFVVQTTYSSTKGTRFHAMLEGERKEMERIAEMAKTAGYETYVR